MFIIKTVDEIPSDIQSRDTMIISKQSGAMFLDSDNKRISLGGASTDSPYSNTAPGDINYAGRFDIPNEYRSIDRNNVLSRFNALRSKSLTISDVVISDCGYHNNSYWAVVFYLDSSNVVGYDVLKSSNIDFNTASLYGSSYTVVATSTSTTHKYEWTGVADIVKQPSGSTHIDKLVVYVLAAEVSTDNLACLGSRENIRYTTIETSTPNWTTVTSDDVLVFKFDGSSTTTKLSALEHSWMHTWGNYIMITYGYKNATSSSYYRRSAFCRAYSLTTLATQGLKFSILNGDSLETVQSPDKGSPILFSDTYCACIELGQTGPSNSYIEIYDTSGTRIGSYVIGTGSDGVPDIFRLSSDKRQVLYGYDSDYECSAMDLSSSSLTTYRIYDSELRHGKTYTITSIDGLRNYAIALYAPFGVEHLYYLFKTNAQQNASTACIPLKSDSIRMFSDESGEYLCVDNLDGTEDRFKIIT